MGLDALKEFILTNGKKFTKILWHLLTNSLEELLRDTLPFCLMENQAKAEQLSARKVNPSEKDTELVKDKETDSGKELEKETKKDDGKKEKEKESIKEENKANEQPIIEEQKENDQIKVKYTKLT
jgi:hypothetical protein